MMSLRSVALGALVLALPVSVEVPASSDSARGGGGETRVTVAGGVGHYAIIERGCEGQVIDTHPVVFREAGGAIEHRLSNDLVLGLRGGVIHDKTQSSYLVTDYSVYPYRDSLVVVVTESKNAYVNPSFAIEGQNFGVGVGWIWSTHEFRTARDGDQIEPSFHLRGGSLSGVYLKLGLMENVPLYAGGGYADMGIGVHPHRLWDVYVGMSASSPYDGPGLALKLDYRVLPHWALAGRARLGGSGGESENGMGVGLTYASRLAVPPGREPAWARGSAWRWALDRPRSITIPQDSTPSAAKGVPAEEPLPEFGQYVYVDSLPQVVSRSAPTYPDSARSSGVEGTVAVAALIGGDGTVREARIVKSIPLLDAAALACVREWVFRPAVAKGKPVANWTVVPVVFARD